MTTFKTPLPEKQYNIARDFDGTTTGGTASSSLNIERTLDCIITYLAELTEVVEGKQENKKGKDIIVCPIHGCLENGWRPTHYCHMKVMGTSNSECLCTCTCNQAPTLKEQNTDDFHGEGLKALIEESKTPTLKEQLLRAKKRILVVADNGEVIPQDVILLEDLNRIIP
jgi:hypothetical protein